MYDFTYMRYLHKSNSYMQKVGWLLPGAGVGAGENKECLLSIVLVFQV